MFWAARSDLACRLLLPHSKKREKLLNGVLRLRFERSRLEKPGLPQKHSHMQVADDKPIKGAVSVVQIVVVNMTAALARLEQARRRLIDPAPALRNQQRAEAITFAARLPDRQTVERQRNFAGQYAQKIFGKARQVHLE